MEPRGHTNLGCVIRRAKDELRSAVVPRTDVRHVWLVFDENLGAAEIAKLEHARCRIQKQVLWLDVSMADALGMDVREGAEQLIDEKLDLEDGHDRLHLVEVTGGAVYSLRDEFENEVEVNLIFLQSTGQLCP